MSKRFRTFDEDRRVLPKLGKPSRFESTPHSREQVTSSQPPQHAWDFKLSQDQDITPFLGMKTEELEYLKRLLTGKTPAVHETVVGFSTTSVPSFSQSWVLSHMRLPKLKNHLKFYLATRPYYPSTINLSEEWIAFAEKEVSLSHRPISELVAPSGDFSANCPLYIQYHCPTFATGRKDWAFTADNTNACTRMTLKKGLNPLTQPIVQGEVFWRRESTKGRIGGIHPYDKNNDQAVLDLHDNFSKLMYQIVNPLVVLLFGKAVEKKFFDTYAAGCRVQVFNVPSFQPFRSGDRHMRLYMLKRMGIICRVAVACPHPEAIFFPQKVRGMGRHIDECIQLAVELAGLEIPLNMGYFEFKENCRWHKAEMGWQTDASFNIVQCITEMARYENVSAEQDTPIEAVAFDSIPKEVRQVFTEWTGKPATEDEMNKLLVPLCPEPHQSLARGLHILMLQRAGVQEPSLGYPGIPVRKRPRGETEQIELRKARAEEKRRVKALAAEEEKEEKKRVKALAAEDKEEEKKRVKALAAEEKEEKKRVKALKIEETQRLKALEVEEKKRVKALEIEEKKAEKENARQRRRTHKQKRSV